MTFKLGEVVTIPPLSASKPGALKQCGTKLRHATPVLALAMIERLYAGKRAVPGTLLSYPCRQCTAGTSDTGGPSRSPK